VTVAPLVKSSPTLTTQASASVAVGGSVTDTATLAGGSTPGGTITFNLYGPGDTTCATPVFTTSKPVAGNGAYTSAAFATTSVGTYRWTASYCGDPANNAVSDGCDAANETVAVTKATPALSTHVALQSVAVSAKVADVITLSGGFGPTGTLTI